MTTATTFTPGSVIVARQRLWRVDAQAQQVLTATAIDGGEPEQRQFYLPFEPVRPGRLEPPNPEIVGQPAAQALLLQAYRLSLLHGTAPLISLQRSRVIPKDYQLVPVVMALELPRVRLLIADDVGLGKTIEAGLIMTELLARQPAARVLLIVPANLREQWQEALDTFFHLPARIISTRHRREMERELPPGANPWAAYRCLITSVDYAKQPAIKNQILEQRWDVVVIDEAHQVAKPHQSSPDQHIYMDRWELAQALATSQHIYHLLLLTATPHNGYTDTFASLLRLLDAGMVEGPLHAPRVVRERALRHVCQRRREDVEAWFADDLARSPFPRREQAEVIIAPSAYEKEALDAVQAYGEQVLSNAATGTAQTRTLANWTVLHLHKRGLSSPAALRASLRNRRRRLRERLEGLASGAEDASIAPDVARANVLDEDTGEWFTEEEAGQRTERTVFGTPELLRAELALLETVLERAERVTPRRDSKLQKLLDSTLPALLAHDPHVVIFTRYVDTLTYLAEQVAADKRYATTEILTIHGGLNERQRREVFIAFEQAAQGILIATDAISEGINLQHAAAQVIHYELPWNPNRLEQRNGRVDRFGQRRSLVRIRTLVMDETLDAAILKVLVEKAARIRRDYGFSPPYFGDETDILALIREHEITLGGRQLGLFDPLPAPVDGDRQDPFAEETLQRIREDSFYGQTHIALPEIEARLQETEATLGSPAQIRQFVFSGLHRFGCGVRENGDGTWRIALQNPALQVGAEPVIARATFDAELGLADPGVTVLDLGHPLVRRLIELVKREGFTGMGGLHYGRTAYKVTSAVTEVTAVFTLLARYAVQTEPTSLIEELLPVAISVYGTEEMGNGKWGIGAEPERMLQEAPTSQTRTEAEVREALHDALTLERLDALLTQAVETRRAELVAERAALRERLAAQEATAWLHGLDRLAPGTFDLLTVTVLFPA